MTTAVVTPLQRTHIVFQHRMESSFLQSLASIHMDTSKSTSRSRRHSTYDETDSKSKTAQSGPRRRATVSGPASTGLKRPADAERCTLTPQGERPTIQGILRHDDDKETYPHHRVSFSHNEDGTLDRHVSNYTIGSAPKGSAATTATGSSIRSGSISPKEATRPSLRTSRNWPPPPPPRPSSKNSPTSATAEKNLASLFQRNPHNNIELPFPTSTAARCPSRPLRRYSMIEMEQQKQDIRAASPTFVASQLHRRSFDGPDQEKTRQKHTKRHGTIRRDYHLGESARSLSHMNVESSPRAAEEKASQLKNYDFAFIKRTDGSWTYAILAYRSINENGSDPKEECMMFVMNEEGSTKMIKKPQWADFIRCVVPHDGGSQPREMPEEFVPRSISVGDGGEDCSMISFNSGY